MENEMDLIRSIWKENVDHLYLLYEVNRDLSATRDVAKLLEKIVDAAVRAINADAGSLLLVDQDTGELHFKVVKGSRAETIRRANVRLKPKEGIVGAVASTGEPVLCNDVTADSRFSQTVDYLTGFKTQAVLAVPITYQRRVLGVLEVINKRSEPFSSKDQDLLVALASGAAVVYENARLTEELLGYKIFQQTILENMPGGFISVDAEGRVVNFNPRSGGILGVDGHPFLGLPVQAALKDHPELLKPLRAALDDRAAVRRQETKITVEGKPVRVGYSTMVLQDDQDRLLGAAITFQQL